MSTFNVKYNLVLKYKNSWQRHTSFEEDNAFRDPAQASKYNDPRLIMQDDTRIEFNYKPLLECTQRLVYQPCYVGNYTKGEAHLQCCGWCGSWDL